MVSLGIEVGRWAAAMLGVRPVRNAIFLAGIVALVGAGVFFGFQLSHAGQVSFVLWVGLPTVALALVGVLRAREDGVLREWLTVRGGDFTRGFVGAAVLFAAAWTGARVLAPLGSPRESWLARLYLQIGDVGTLRLHVVFVVAVIVVLAIAEEIVWRGLVPLLLSDFVGTRRAWVWAAVLYALAHLPTAIALRDPVAGLNPLLPAAALVAGLVWGGMVRGLGRLWPAIFAHVLFDWAVVMMFRLWRL